MWFILFGKNCMIFWQLLIFFKINFFKHSFRNTIRVLNRLDPVQARHFVGPDLVPNCFQMSRAEEFTGRLLSPNKGRGISFCHPPLVCEGHHFGVQWRVLDRSWGLFHSEYIVNTNLYNVYEKLNLMNTHKPKI